MKILILMKRHTAATTKESENNTNTSLEIRNLENIKRFALGIYIWKALSVILLKIQKEESTTNMWYLGYKIF